MKPCEKCIKEASASISRNNFSRYGMDDSNKGSFCCCCQDETVWYIVEKDEWKIRVYMKVPVLEFKTLHKQTSISVDYNI